MDFIEHRSTFLYSARSRFNKTPILTILIFVSILVVGEVLSRTPIAARLLGYPSTVVDSGYTPAIEKFPNVEAIAAHDGHVQCIIIGSSQVERGIIPEVFERVYNARSGKSIKCYNFGLAALHAFTAEPVVEVLLKRYKPELLIYGLQRRDFVDSTPDETVETTFAQSPWIQYNRGDFNVQGWLLDTSYFYRYISTLPKKVFTRQDSTYSQIDVSAGFRPRLNFLSVSPLLATNKQPSLTISEPPVPSARNIESFNKLVDKLQHANVRAIIIEMPVPQLQEQPTPSSLDLAFNDAVRYARDHHVPFWTANYSSLSLNSELWYDTAHLHVSGANVFSEWLGNQVGEAEKRGMMRPTLSDELLSSAPLGNEFPAEPAYNKTLGLSADKFRIFQERRKQFNLIPTQSLVLNSCNTEFSPLFLETSLGFFIDWDLYTTNEHRADLFDLLVTLNAAHCKDQMGLPPSNQALIDKWTTTQLPGYLKEAGVDYILYIKGLRFKTTSQNPELLSNKDYYQLIKKWDYPPLYEQLTVEVELLHVVGNQK